MRWGIRREKCVEVVAASLSFEGKLCASILNQRLGSLYVIQHFVICWGIAFNRLLILCNAY